MKRIFLLALLTIPFILFGQQSNLFKLNPSDFNSFPKEFKITNQVFQYYYEIGFTNKKLDSLNDAQKALCLHFICDGWITNDGIWAILGESKGEYNVEYPLALARMSDTASKKVFDEIVVIYKKYEKWFSKKETPPILDENSKKFDQKLFNRIEGLEKMWYANQATREKLFNEYLSIHKSELVKLE
jgi:hypothetical protein